MGKGDMKNDIGRAALPRHQNSARSCSKAFRDIRLRQVVAVQALRTDGGNMVQIGPPNANNFKGFAGLNRHIRLK
jgi:hypothetical protein